eukprot:363984-Chlamydomonas_euryale.AAC.12
MHHAPCAMHHAPCTMHRAPCTMHHAPCTMHQAPSTMHHAPCAMHHAPCTKHDAPCTMHQARCTKHDAPCTMHHAPCAMHHAPCTMHHAPHSLCECSPATTPPLYLNAAGRVPASLPCTMLIAATCSSGRHNASTIASSSGRIGTAKATLQSAPVLAIAPAPGPARALGLSSSLPPGRARALGLSSSLPPAEGGAGRWPCARLLASWPKISSSRSALVSTSGLPVSRATTTRD